MTSAAAPVRAHTAGTSTVSGTTVTFTVAAGGVQAGNRLFAFIGFDNLNATTPVTNTVSVPAGETAAWVRSGSINSASATAGAGVRGEMWYIKPATAWPAGTVITFTLSAAVVAKAVVCEEFSDVGKFRGQLNDFDLAAASSAALSGSNAPSHPGELVVGGLVLESNVAPTADADTTLGTWDTGNTAIANTGVSATSCSIRLQWKVVTAGGTQTFNKTDVVNGGCVAQSYFLEVVAPPIARRAAVLRAAGY